MMSPEANFGSTLPCSSYSSLASRAVRIISSCGSQAARFVASKPIPFEEATNFELVISLISTKAQGLLACSRFVCARMM
jgi:hypothetical protein